MTATQAFATFAAERDLAIAWVDTAQSNFPVPPASVRIRRAIKRLLRFRQLVKDPEVEGVVLFAGAGFGFIERSVLALLARERGLPTLMMIRSGHFQTSYRKGGWSRLLWRLLLRIPHLIGVQGESWLSFMHEAGVAHQRLVVLPSWLGRPPQRPHRRFLAHDQTLRMVFVGWVTAEKGIPELIVALERVIADGRDIELVLIGGGTLLDAARAAQSRLGRRLIITGWLDPSEVSAQLADAHLLVLPSHAEGFPNIVMEAMAEGLPVIATPVGAIPDTVEDGVNGMLVPVGNAPALADAIARYCDEPDLIAVHSKTALQTAARRHDRDTNCRKLLDELSRIRTG